MTLQSGWNRRQNDDKTGIRKQRGETATRQEHQEQESAIINQEQYSAHEFVNGHSTRHAQLIGACSASTTDGPSGWWRIRPSIAGETAWRNRTVWRSMLPSLLPVRHGPSRTADRRRSMPWCRTIRACAVDTRLYTFHRWRHDARANDNDYENLICQCTNDGTIHDNYLVETVSTTFTDHHRQQRNTVNTHRRHSSYRQGAG
jgi:hypothetical protein